MKKLLLFISLFISIVGFAQSKSLAFNDKKIILTKASLQDKIKGGWAGQTIGVTYGGPYEFKFLGTMVQDYQKLEWQHNRFKYAFEKEPGLYDDIYMDFSFVDVIERYGVDAPVDAFANAFAHASYPLWHANQAGRYNLLNGLKAPASGHWKNNPHADDIDFQIEADFAGLMYPGMSVAASKLCDKVGHIMNYGDGYYGGLYMASLYTQAFVSDDVNWVVNNALKVVPKESNYYKCMSDVIKWHAMFPNDWKRTWFEIQRKWTNDIGCTDGVFKPFDISSNVNSAYVIMGLLYGEGNFEKTMEIAIRCGQDADCNPASAAGILGTIIGYNKIPVKWINDLKEVEDKDFVFTNISLNKMYAIGMKHALAMIEKNGGVVNEHSVTIPYQKPVPVKYEKSFDQLIPLERKSIDGADFSTNNKLSLDFEGTGFAINAGLKNEWNSDTDIVYKLAISVDGKNEIVSMPFNFKTRKPELYFNYNLKEGSHHIDIKLLNPNSASAVNIYEIITYSNKKN